MSCSGWSAVNPVCQVKDALGGVASDAASGVFSTIADAFGNVAAAMVNWLWGQISDATAVDLTTSEGIKTDLLATGAIAALISVSLFLIQIIASVLKQESGGMLRAARGLATSFIGAAFAVATTQILLGAVDALSNGVVQFALGTNIEGMGKKLLATGALTLDNPAAQLLIALVVIAAVVIVWAAMMIRKMLIIISAVFAPIAFAGASSDLTKNWVKKWVEFTAALIFSKLILVIIFMIGLSVLNGAGQTSTSGPGSAGQKITQLSIGTLTLLLAGLAPWIAIKFVHFAGESFNAAASQAGVAGQGAGKVVSAPQKALSKAGSAAQNGQSIKSMLGGKGSGGGGPAGGGGKAGGGPQTKGAPTAGPATPGAGAGGKSGGPAGGGPAGGAGGVPAAGGGGAAGGAAAAGPAAAAVAVPAAVIGGAKAVAGKVGEQADQARPAPSGSGGVSSPSAAPAATAPRASPPPQAAQPPRAAPPSTPPKSA